MKPLNGIIDRFEDDKVVIEIDDEIKVFPRSYIKYPAKAGDAVQIVKNQITFDENRTRKIKEEIDQLILDVWKDE